MSHVPRRHAHHPTPAPDGPSPVPFRVPGPPLARASALRELAVFYGLVFFITWGLAAALFLAPDLVVGAGGIGSGRGQVFFYLAVVAPSVVAVLLTVRARGLRAGLGDIARGALAPGRWWRTGMWLVIGAFVIPVAWVVVFALSHLGVADPADNQLDIVGVFVLTPLTLLTTSFLLTDPGALGEEFGWRGYALPRLLQVMNPTAAGVVVGALMALWHIPSFFAAQLPQSDLNFLLMATNWVGWGVISSWIHLRSGGNWVAAGVLPHAMLNCAYMLGVADINWISGTGALLAAVIIAALAPGRTARRDGTGNPTPAGRAVPAPM